MVWAAEHGIAKGMTDTTFAPNMAVTREQMVTFLYRYANLAGEDVTGDYDLTEFGDHGAIHNYAKEPLAWAVDKGLVTGMDGLLNPRGNEPGRRSRLSSCAIVRTYKTVRVSKI